MRAPKVTVTNIGRVDGDKWDRFTAQCECGWDYSNLVKTDVQQKATWHRRDHRARLAVTQ